MYDMVLVGKKNSSARTVVGLCSGLQACGWWCWSFGIFWILLGVYNHHGLYRYNKRCSIIMIGLPKWVNSQHSICTRVVIAVCQDLNGWSFIINAMPSRAWGKGHKFTWVAPPANYKPRSIFIGWGDTTSKHHRVCFYVMWLLLPLSMAHPII